MRNYRASSATILLPLLILFTLTPLAAFADDTPTITVQESNAATRRHFDTAFAALSEQAKATILAEGAPLHAELTNAQLTTLNQSLPPNVSTSDAITAIAAAFDYDVETVDTHTILLRKRYSDPMDLPCVTYEEIVHSVREILKVTDVLYPHSADDEPYANLLRFSSTLTPEQLQRAGHGIHLSDLTPEQRPLAMDAALDMTLNQKTDALHETLRRLVLLQSPRTVFAWSSPEVFGYRGAFGTNRQPVDVPLADGLTEQAKFNIPAINVPALTQGDTSSPFVHTLREAALLGSSPSAPPPTIRAIVADSIADKPVLVYGEQYSSHEQIIRSLVKLYGLQLYVLHPGVLTITLPSTHSIDGIRDLPLEINRLIPLPIKRALAKQTDRAMLNFPLRTPQSPVFVKDPVTGNTYMPPITQEAQTRLAQHIAIDTWYSPAVYCLLAKAEPLVPTLQSPPISIKAVGPEALRLVAFTLLKGSSLEEVVDLAHWHVPTYFDQPDAMALQVGFHPGHDVAMGVGTVDPATGNVRCNIFTQYAIHEPQ